MPPRLSLIVRLLLRRKYMLAYTELDSKDTRTMLWLGVPTYIVSVLIGSTINSFGWTLLILVGFSVIYSFIYSKIFSSYSIRNERKPRATFYLMTLLVQVLLFGIILLVAAI